MPGQSFAKHFVAGTKAGKKGPKSKWRTYWYVEVYEMAKAGLTDTSIAKGLGIHAVTFGQRKRKDKILRKTLKKARGGQTALSHGETFADYIYGKLPPDLRKTWKRLKKCQTAPNHVERIEALLAGRGRAARQHLLFYALVRYNFSKTKACRAVGISPVTFDKWCMSDPDFATIIESIHTSKKDFFEEALFKLAKHGEKESTRLMAVLAGNKAYNKDRGFAPADKKITHTHEGSVKHKVGVSVDQLNLPLEAKKALLKAMREARGGVIPETNNPQKALPTRAHQKEREPEVITINEEN